MYIISHNCFNCKINIKYIISIIDKMILVVPKIIILLAVCIKYVILLKWSRPYNASRWLMGWWLGESWSRHSSVLTRALALSPGRRPPKGKVFKFAALPPHPTFPLLRVLRRSAMRCASLQRAHSRPLVVLEREHTRPPPLRTESTSESRINYNNISAPWTSHNCYIN